MYKKAKILKESKFMQYLSIYTIISRSSPDEEACNQTPRSTEPVVTQHEIKHEA